MPLRVPWSMDGCYCVLGSGVGVAVAVIIGISIVVVAFVSSTHNQCPLKYALIFESEKFVTHAKGAGRG